MGTEFESRQGRPAYSAENAWAADPGLRRAAARREMGVRQTRQVSTWAAASRWPVTRRSAAGRY